MICESSSGVPPLTFDKAVRVTIEADACLRSLDHKVTLNGVKFDEAMAHLTVLELAGKAETSRANLLGNNVREYLLKQWSPQGVVVE